MNPQPNSFDNGRIHTEECVEAVSSHHFMLLVIYRAATSSMAQLSPPA